MGAAPIWPGSVRFGFPLSEKGQSAITADGGLGAPIACVVRFGSAPQSGQSRFGPRFGARAPSPRAGPLMPAQARAALSGWLQGRPDFERLGGFGHVMHAHDGGAALNRQQGCGYAGADALLGRGRLLPRRGQRRPQRRAARSTARLAGPARRSFAPPSCQSQCQDPA